MRRWFIALLTLFVAAQMSWAGAALCCVAELPGQPAGAPGLIVSDQAHAPADAAHAVCETAHCHCHHAGCATPAAEAPLPARPLLPGPELQTAARLKSHIPPGLERPNWLRA